MATIRDRTDTLRASHRAATASKTRGTRSSRPSLLLHRPPSSSKRRHSNSKGRNSHWTRLHRCPRGSIRKATAGSSRWRRAQSSSAHPKGGRGVRPRLLVGRVLPLVGSATTGGPRDDMRRAGWGPLLHCNGSLVVQGHLADVHPGALDDRRRDTPASCQIRVLLINQWQKPSRTRAKCSSRARGRCSGYSRVAAVFFATRRTLAR